MKITVNQLVVVNDLPDATLYRVKFVEGVKVGVIDAGLPEKNQAVQVHDKSLFHQPSKVQLAQVPRSSGRVRVAPMTRQYLGTFIVKHEGNARKIRVYVNPGEVAEQLAARAIKSPMRRARAIFNAVLVEDIGAAP